MTVRTSLLLGSTTWLGCEPPLDELDEPLELWTPPGVTRIVLAGGGGGVEVPPLELPPELLLPPLEAWPDGLHGWTARFWVSAPDRTTIWLEPGGIAVLPCAVVDCACEHGGMATVRACFCLGMTTMRIPRV